MFAKLVSLVTLALLCGGCIAPRTAGQVFNDGYADHIVVGRTSRAEILANLGPPLLKFAPDSDANETWIWAYESSGGDGPILSFKGAVHEKLRVTFVNGVVADCMFSTSLSGGTMCGGKVSAPPT